MTSPGFFNENQWMANGDYVLSDRNKIAVRYFGALSNQEWTTLYQTEGFPLYQPERFDVASIGDTFILSPNMVNQFLVGFHRSTSNQSYGNAFTFSSLGMNAPAEDNAYPNIWFISDGFQTGTTSATYFLEEEDQITDTLSWIKGKHQFTFGGGFTYGRDNMGKFYFRGLCYSAHLGGFPAGAELYCPMEFHTAISTRRTRGLETFCATGDIKMATALFRTTTKIAKRLTLNLGLALGAHRRPRISQWRGQRRCVEDQSQSAGGRAASTATLLTPITTAPLSPPE